MSTINRFLVVALTMILAATSFSFAQEKSLHKRGTTMTRKVSRKVVYYCPKHPNVTSSKRGKCRVCGMDLVKKKAKRLRK